MKAARLVLLALAALGLGGCAVLNRSVPAPKAGPRPVAERALDLDAFIAEHNQNADLIQSLKAQPTIAVRSKSRTVQADGKLGMIRPRNFKLELSAMGQTKANIGSNDQEFWFWVQNDDDRSIYWCNYDEVESSALAVTYQPDWILEALGLRPINPEEAAALRVRTTDNPKLSAVVFPPAKSRGQRYQRMMIVSNYTRRVKEYRIVPLDRPETTLARAMIASYKDFDIDKSESGAYRSCYLPENLKLEWTKDQLLLDVALKDVEVNQFDTSRAAAIFAEPVIPGYDRVNLADMPRSTARDKGTTARRTLQPPASRNGVKLGRPAVIDESDDAPRGAPHVTESPFGRRHHQPARRPGGRPPARRPGERRSPPGIGVRGE